MKKIIALALALIMALSMASVAFAAPTEPTYATPVNGAFAPGSLVNLGGYDNDVYKVKSFDFTTGAFDGASYVKSVKINKWDKLVLELKESYTLTDAKAITGEVVLAEKAAPANTTTVPVAFYVNNDSTVVYGEKKAADATDTITSADKVWICEEDSAGYVKVEIGTELKGTVKMAAKEKAYLNLLSTAKGQAGEATKDAIDEYVGDDYEAIVEYYVFETRAFKEAVDFQYDAYQEDPHFFYAWDGEKLTQIEAKYDDDEDVDDYVFSAVCEGAIIVTDTEIVLAAEEETKNPDTGANDVVGVAAALAVVSLVAAGAVSLKK